VAVAPDGRGVLYWLGDIDASPAVGDLRLVPISADATFGSPALLTDQAAFSGVGTEWGPQADRLLYRTIDGQSSTLWYVELDGTSPGAATEVAEAVIVPGVGFGGRFGPSGGDIYWFRGEPIADVLAGVTYRASIMNGRVGASERLTPTGVNADAALVFANDAQQVLCGGWSDSDDTSWTDYAYYWVDVEDPQEGLRLGMSNEAAAAAGHGARFSPSGRTAFYPASEAHDLPRQLFATPIDEPDAAYPVGGDGVVGIWTFELP
jgi:hypothetical protein